MSSRNNVKKARKLSTNAVNLFKVAHDGIVQANDLLAQQLAVDSSIIEELSRAVKNHNSAINENAKLITNLKQFIPA